MIKAYHSDNLVYHLGIFAANKVNFTWFVTVILGLDASTFRWVKGACSVIPCDAPLNRCALKRVNRVDISIAKNKGILTSKKSNLTYEC